MRAATRAALLVSLAVRGATAPASPGPLRYVLDVELLALHHESAPGGEFLNAALVVGAGAGLVAGELVPYAMAAAGLFTLQLRAGVMFLPRGLERPSPLARVELRPELAFLPTLDRALRGSLGVGFRWPGRPGRYVLALVEAGEVWFRRGSTRTSPGVDGQGTFMGGTVAFGFDW